MREHWTFNCMEIEWHRRDIDLNSQRIFDLHLEDFQSNAQCTCFSFYFYFTHRILIPPENKQKRWHGQRRKHEQRVRHTRCQKGRTRCVWREIARMCYADNVARMTGKCRLIVIVAIADARCCWPPVAYTHSPYPRFLVVRRSPLQLTYRIY